MVLEDGSRHIDFILSRYFRGELERRVAAFQLSCYFDRDTTEELLDMVQV